jgi:uncharacterized protein (TIGR03437 family)
LELSGAWSEMMKTLPMIRNRLAVDAPVRYSSCTLFAQLLLLALSGHVLSAANAAITAQVSSETAPPGGYAQFKISLTAPGLVSQASISMKFDPTIFGTPTSVAGFSATGDQTGRGGASGQLVEAALTSQSSSLGQLPGMPVLVVTVPVLQTAKIGATSSITFDPSPIDFQRINSWGDPQGNPYTLTVIPGTFTVGGSLSIQSVTPGGGLLPLGTVVQINGTGFDATTIVSIDGVSIASIQLVNAQEINVTLGGATEMNGKHVHVSRPGGESRDYFAALTNTGGLILPSLPWPSSTVIEWPVSQGLTEFFSCLQNPGAVPVTATYFQAPFGPGPAPSQTVVVPPYGMHVAYTNAIDNGSAAGPLFMTASAPLRMAVFESQPENFLSLVGAPAQLAALPPELGVMKSSSPTPSTGIGTLVSPTSLIFSLSPGEAAPAQPQTVTVQLLPNFTASVTTQSGGDWLSITYNGSFVYVNATAANLSVGTYTGTVNINQSPAVSVTLIVAAPGQMSVAPSALVLTAPAQTTATGVLNVSVHSGTPYFSVQSMNLDPNQFESAVPIMYSVTPTSSTNQFMAPATILVTGSFSLPGLHYASLTVSWNGGSAVIPVTLIAIPTSTMPPVMNAIVGSGSATPGSIAPGELITIFGSGLGAAPADLQLNSNQTVATNLGGTEVLINGSAAPLVYSSTGQVNAIVPYEAGSSGTASVQVVSQGIQSSAWAVPLAPSAPSIFTASASGVGQGAIVNQDGSVNRASKPAIRGTAIQIYATGGGQTSPASSTGSVAPTSANLALAVHVTIGGVDAQVLYAGNAPGEVEGVVQINAIVPQSVTPGGALPLLVTVGGVTSTVGATVAVQ